MVNKRRIRCTPGEIVELKFIHTDEGYIKVEEIHYDLEVYIVRVSSEYRIIEESEELTRERALRVYEEKCLDYEEITNSLGGVVLDLEEGLPSEFGVVPSFGWMIF